MEVDNLKDFNEVVKFYDLIQKLLKQINPRTSEYEVKRKVRESEILEFGLIPSRTRAMVSNIALFLTQAQERIKDINDTDISKRIIRNNDILQDIHGNGNMPEKEKIRQLRNSLAHSGYTMRMDVTDSKKIENVEGRKIEELLVDTKLMIANDKINGTVTIYELLELIKRYENTLNYIQNGDAINYLTLVPSKCGKEDHKPSVIKIDRKKDRSGIDLNKLRYRYGKLFKKDIGQVVAEGFIDDIAKGYESFDIQKVDIPPEKVKKIEKLITYIGQNNMMNFNDFNNEIINRILETDDCEYLPIDLIVGFFSVMFDLSSINQRIKDESYRNIDEEYCEYATVFDVKKNSKINGLFNMLYGFRFVNPILYANNLLAKSYYMMNYVREINEQEGKKYFDYFDIQNLDGITVYEEDTNGNRTEKKVQVNPLQRFKDDLKEVDNAINELKREKIEKEKIKSRLRNPRLRGKNKTQTESLDEINKWLNSYSKKSIDLAMKKQILEQRVSDGRNKGLDVNNSFHFFRHLRNSLAHGTYEIIYDDYNELDEVRYNFKDTDPNTQMVYTVELTASQLEKVLEGFQLKVNECNKGFLDGQKMEREILRKAMLEMGIIKSEVDEDLEFVSQVAVIRNREDKKSKDSK